jgi:hypothetical protein
VGNRISTASPSWRGVEGDGARAGGIPVQARCQRQMGFSLLTRYLPKALANCSFSRRSGLLRK